MRELTELPVFLLPKEVAELLRVSLKAVYAMVERGALPKVQIGRGIRIRRDDLLLYLGESRAPSLKEKKR